MAHERSTQPSRVWEWSRTAFVGLLGVSLAVLLGLVARDSSRLVGETFPGFLVWDNGTLVSFHTESWTGAQAGLPLNGGRVISVDGQPFSGGRDLLATAASMPAGALISYQILQRESVREFEVATMRLSWGQYLQTFGNYLFNGTFCFIIGLIALALRPDHPPARAFALAIVNLGLLLTLAVDFLATYRFVVFCQLVEATMPAAVVAMLLVFPVERVPLATRWWLVTGLFLATMSVGAVNAFFFYADPETARQAWRLANGLTAASGIALVAVFSHALLRANTPAKRLQAGVVFAGALAAFLFPAIAIFAFSMLGWNFSLTWVSALLFLFPISIFYAVMRHDLLHAERVIRIAVGYTLATSAIVLVYTAVLMTLDRLVAPGVARGPAANFLLLMGIAVSFDPLRQRVQKAVDRVFFRSTVEPGAVLEEVGAQLVLIQDEHEITRDVGELLRDALDLEWAELAAPDTQHPDAALLEPVQFRGEALGLLVCGRKRSGSPFSISECELVAGIAAQAALAIRNARSIQVLRETQEALLRTERFAVIGEFAGAVAHGIRNPLSGIRAAAQIAREQAEGTAVAETLTGVLDESDRLEQRVRSLLDFSRPFDIEFEWVDLPELLGAVRTTISGQAGRQGVKISLAIDSDATKLESDPIYLEEVLLELSSNSIRAMPQGGVLNLTAAVENGHTVIRVTDTGRGITAAVQGRVFELFFTTRGDGTGMGLATVKKIMSRLGGTIQLESSGSKGTTFRLDFARPSAQGFAITRPK
jgi:signal transduction histidine kinase